MSEDEEIVTLDPPLTEEEVDELEAGDLVEISGTIVTVRDEAYERILKLSGEGKELPVDLEGGVVYHCGPLAESTDGGWKIIAAGPTTSARLDELQVNFVESTGVRALVGKGGVGKEVASNLCSLGCVYLAFPGGAAALAAEAIKSIKDVIWEDLGTVEATWILEVEKFGPMIVGIDVGGRNLYRRG